MKNTIFNPSSYCSISSAANAFHWAWEKTAQWWAFFVYCSEIKVLVKRKNDSPVNHLSFWLYEGMKNKAFLHVWFSKVLLLEINFSMKQRKKTTSKKTSWTTKQSQTKCLLHLCLFFKTRLRTTEVQQLLLFLKQATQKLFRAQMRKFFFLCILRKQGFQQTNCFFLWTKPFCNEKEKPSKKEVELVLLFFCSFFAFCQSGKPKTEKRAFTKVATKSEDSTLVFFKVGKTFLSLHCCLFWVKTVWNQKERKTNCFLTSFQTTLVYVYVIFAFFFRVCISKNFLSKHALILLKRTFLEEN